MGSSNNIQAMREARGWSRPELAKRMGTSGQQIERLEKGQRRLAQDWIDKAAVAFDVPPTDIIAKVFAEQGRTPGEGHARGELPDVPPTRSVDLGEAVAIMRMDLSYAMGPGTNLDDSYVESEPVIFDLGFLRGLTRADPSQLRIVDGVGDSMFPTILDRELLIIDVSQRMLNMQDRIWAISLYGAGALKRLRTIGKDRVLVISDNPDIPDQEVAASDITIAGRLVGSIKRH